MSKCNVRGSAGKKNGCSPNVIPSKSPLSSTQEESQAMATGVSAYLSEDCTTEEFMQALPTATQPSSPDSRPVVQASSFARPSVRSESDPLTAREREVLQLVAEGLSSRQMASRLFISSKTVETHRQHVMDKLAIHTVAGLTKYAIREGLTPLSPSEQVLAVSE